MQKVRLIGAESSAKKSITTRWTLVSDYGSFSAFTEADFSYISWLIKIFLMQDILGLMKSLF